MDTDPRSLLGGAVGERAAEAVAALFGVVQILASVLPSLLLSLVALVILGAVGISFLALANSTLQLTAAPEMRGRVMGLWAVAFLGTTPSGAPVMGWVGEHLGARWALGLGGVAILIAAAIGRRVLTTVDNSAGHGDQMETRAAKLDP